MKPPQTAVALPSDEEWDKDKGNPRNWSLSRRIWYIFVSVLPGIAVTVSTSIYTPGLAQVVKEFHVSAEVALLPLSLQLLGQATGQILAAPVSESFGRQAIYIVTVPIFSLFILGSALSQTFASLVICRFFAGLFGAADIPLAVGILSDIWRPEQRLLPFSIAVAVQYAASPTGILLGAYASINGWRWTQYVVLFLCVPMIAFVLTLKETFKREIVRRRAPIPEGGPIVSFLKAGVAGMDLGAMIRPIHMLFTEPIVIIVAVYTSFTFAVLYGFFSGVPYIYKAVYKFSIQSIGLVFIAASVGYLASMPTVLLVEKWTHSRLRRGTGKQGDEPAAYKNEYALFHSILGGPFFPISLFWLAWSARPDVHYMVPTVAVGVYSWSSALIYTGNVTYLARVYGPKYGASATAANRVLAYMFGVAFPLFTTKMYKGLGIGWATSLMAFVGVALLPVPWFCYRYGARLVARGRYDRDY